MVTCGSEVTHAETGNRRLSFWPKSHPLLANLQKLGRGQLRCQGFDSEGKGKRGSGNIGCTVIEALIL